MNTVNASEFKANFGNTLDRLERETVKIQRRGRGAAILMSESAYADLLRSACRPTSESQEALTRLKNLSKKSKSGKAFTKTDDRTRALLEKHLGNRR
jgi:PHD/YefM family antitoxin component YafN of YafNO toxin-antitoxin module